MNLLFVIGGCLQINSSANLCHLAYLRGFAQAGHHIELLTAEDAGAQKDVALALPAGVVAHTYGVSLYEKLSHIKKQASRRENAATVPAAADAQRQGALAKIKGNIRALYGVYGPDKAWYRRARHFHSDKYFDYVISVSCPFISHYTARELIRRGRVRCGKWIQIWEDPWYGDLAYDSHNEACFREEQRLCAAAQDIVYVSPVTLMYQKQYFPASAEKMRFVPTPSYYPAASSGAGTGGGVFGYFGDYEPSVRNLAPFYAAARAERVAAYICGNSSAPLESTAQITVRARVPLSVLTAYEEKTDVLVFLCNRKGGQIPGKIFQYSAQNKPILFILDGTETEKAAIRSYFAAFDRYIFCENNEEDIRKAIAAALSGEAPRAPLTCFSPEKTAEQILSSSS